MMTETTERDRKPRRPVGRPRRTVDVEQLSTLVPAALLEQVREYTALHGQSIAWFVRQALEEKLAREREGAQ